MAEVSSGEKMFFVSLSEISANDSIKGAIQQLKIKINKHLFSVICSIYGYYL